MTTSDDLALLRRFVDERADDAFGELVHRHVNLVYFAALRQTYGDAGLAEEVTQAVFTDLGRKAGRLLDRTALTGWLYTSARFAANNARRKESRRRAREQALFAMQPTTDNGDDTAAADWARVRPAIDDALFTLDETDREAVLLRFFEGRAFAEIGATLRLTEDTARKRVERALDKMSVTLSRRGITSTSVALGLALAQQAMASAPARLAKHVAFAARGAATSGSRHAGWAGATLATSAILLIAVGSVQAVGALRQGASLAFAVARRDAVQARVHELEERLVAERTQAREAQADNDRLRAAIAAASAAASAPGPDASRIALVIDTSGSMRDPATGKLHAAVGAQFQAILASDPRLKFFQVFDADGRNIISDTTGRWLPITGEMRDEAKRVLASYAQDTVSNAVPGIERALLELDAANDPTSRLVITVLGDESQAAHHPVLRRLEELNPADAKGRRRVTINAVAFPTWKGLTMPIQSHAPAGAGGRVLTNVIASPASDASAMPRTMTTHDRYEKLMRVVTSRHGGTYIAVPDMRIP